MKKQYFLLLLSCMLLFACEGTDRSGVRHSMYYWSTTFKLSGKEKTFLRSNRVGRLYLRYFDLVVDDNGNVSPNATIDFVDTLPSGMEVVPTVFIVNDCMRQSTHGLADKLLRRILQMNETNDIRNVKEIQIDCDWTRQTEHNYFAFLRNLRALAAKKRITLSTTIRLHQLSGNVPPVDRGVLMMYNTGDVTRLNVRKPILDINDVMPYLRQIHSYRLPLSTAYPLFSWRVLFRRQEFIGIQHSSDEYPIIPGDSIVVRTSELDEIYKAKAAVNHYRRDANTEIILFDLSDHNINRFTLKEYEKIYH